MGRPEDGSGELAEVFASMAQVEQARIMARRKADLAWRDAEAVAWGPEADARDALRRLRAIVGGDDRAIALVAAVAAARARQLLGGGSTSVHGG
jgi:hypothetical protein